MGHGDSINLQYPNSNTKRGRIAYQVAHTIQTSGVQGVILIEEETNPYYLIEDEKGKVRIRRLTPKECWRLMDFPDEAYEKAAQVNSNTQLYKQAGNSIVVACLEHIFRNLFSEQTDEPIEEEIEQIINEEPKVLTLWDLI